MFNLMEFFRDIFAVKDTSLVGLRRLNEKTVAEKPKVRKLVRKEYKISELMKKTAVD